MLRRATIRLQGIVSGCFARLQTSLEWWWECFNGAVMVLLWCFNGGVGMLEGWFRYLFELHHRCSPGLPGCLKDVFGMFPVCFFDVSGMFRYVRCRLQACLKAFYNGVSRMLQRCLRHVLDMCQERFWDCSGMLEGCLDNGFELFLKTCQICFKDFSAMFSRLCQRCLWDGEKMTMKIRKFVWDRSNILCFHGHRFRDPFQTEILRTTVRYALSALGLVLGTISHWSWHERIHFYSFLYWFRFVVKLLEMRHKLHQREANLT